MEVPRHIGIIMDGNRRWAEKNGVNELKGHLEGKKRAEEITNKAFDVGVDVLSLYTFSAANLKRRPKAEKKYLFKTFKKTFEELAEDEDIHENHVKIIVSGRWRKLPEEAQNSIEEAMKATKAYKSHYLNFCLVYDGRDEIVDAAKKITKKVKEGLLDIEDIDRGTIERNLYHDLPNPDLIIRTGMKDAKRLSGFLLWGSSYAEFKFRDIFWPDYTPKRLEEDIKEWSQRRRSSHGK